MVAALAAVRAGIRVTPVERYGCFGGLWTADLVLIVLSTHVRAGGTHQKMVHGISDEMLARIAAMRHGAVTYGLDSIQDATTDPEVPKYVMASLLQEAGGDILLNSWATNAIIGGNVVRGVLFESKSGCLAVKDGQVVDAPRVTVMCLMPPTPKACPMCTAWAWSIVWAMCRPRWIRNC
ncbi:MAG TPA: FAD-dependent oxidoreductase [Candidatus Hydrogenedentes bacterium]|nr:FAD-dependent oxidoreductase [Candidatus Hydrogenedentota bacterium]